MFTSKGNTLYIKDMRSTSFSDRMSLSDNLKIEFFKTKIKECSYNELTSLLNKLQEDINRLELLKKAKNRTLGQLSCSTSTQLLGNEKINCLHSHLLNPNQTRDFLQDNLIVFTDVIQRTNALEKALSALSSRAGKALADKRISPKLAESEILVPLAEIQHCMSETFYSLDCYRHGKFSYQQSTYLITVAPRLITEHFIEIKGIQTLFDRYTRPPINSSMHIKVRRAQSFSPRLSGITEENSQNSENKQSNISL